MHRNLSIALALAFGIALTSAPARAQSQPAAAAANTDKPSQQPSDPNTAPAHQPAQDATKAQDTAAKPAGTSDAPKPAPKVHHVITNEDIEAEHEQMASANSDIDISNINDCDKVCFDQVGIATNYAIVRSTDWKRDLLQGIDQVSRDAKWQAVLYRIARQKAKFCELNQDKNDELANTGTPGNMTEDQIELDETYERKFEAAQAALNSAYADADAIESRYSGVVASFMNLQKRRAGSRVCVIRYPVMYRGYRMPLDDPDHP